MKCKTNLINDNYLQHYLHNMSIKIDTNTKTNYIIIAVLVLKVQLLTILLQNYSSIPASTSAVNVMFGPVLVKTRLAAVPGSRADRTRPRFLYFFTTCTFWGVESGVKGGQDCTIARGQ